MHFPIDMVKSALFIFLVALPCQLTFCKKLKCLHCCISFVVVNTRITLSEKRGDHTKPKENPPYGDTNFESLKQRFQPLRYNKQQSLLYFNAFHGGDGLYIFREIYDQMPKYVDLPEAYTSSYFALNRLISSHELDKENDPISIPCSEFSLDIHCDYNDISVLDQHYNVLRSRASKFITHSSSTALTTLCKLIFNTKPNFYIKIDSVTRNFDLNRVDHSKEYGYIYRYPPVSDWPAGSIGMIPHYTYKGKRRRREQEQADASLIGASLADLQPPEQVSEAIDEFTNRVLAASAPAPSPLPAPAPASAFIPSKQDQASSVPRDTATDREDRGLEDFSHGLTPTEAEPSPPLLRGGCLLYSWYAKLVPGASGPPPLTSPSSTGENTPTTSDHEDSLAEATRPSSSSSSSSSSGPKAVRVKRNAKSSRPAYRFICDEMYTDLDSLMFHLEDCLDCIQLINECSSLDLLEVFTSPSVAEELKTNVGIWKSGVNIKYYSSLLP